MLDSFLFDVRQEILLSRNRPTVPQDSIVCIIFLFVFFIGYLIASIFSHLPGMGIAFVLLLLDTEYLRGANWLTAIFTFLRSIVATIQTKSYSLLVMIFKTKVKPPRICKTSYDTRRVEKQAQMDWFIKKRIEVTKRIIDRNHGDVDKAEFIDILIEECKIKLTEIRPSKSIKKKMKPLFSAIALVAVSLSSAYLNEHVFAEAISFNSTPADWVKDTLAIIAPTIIENSNTFALFFIICLYLILFYLIGAFIIFPSITRFFDRTWLLTYDISIALQYLKKDKAYCEPSKK